jgi:hypothetical protein
MSPATPPTSSGRGASVGTYLKAAFLYHWNLLFVVGGGALAALSGKPDALLPIVGGLEIAYLTGLLAMPRFRTAIDAREAAKEREAKTTTRVDPSAQQSLQRMIDTLPQAAVTRFMALRQRCFEMRDIASRIRGQTSGATDSSESIRTPALDRLLFLFLKLLMSQAGLDRFLRSSSEKELSARLEETKARLAAAQAGGGDERTINSLRDSVADGELRLDNYRKSMKDSEFVSIELDRIETKIQALIEMGVSRQDAEALSHQVTAAADSMHQTENAVNQLQHLTGLADSLAEPPAILEADLGRAVLRAR